MTAAGQPFRFVLVGAVGYVVNLVAFSVLLAAGAAYLAGSIGGFFVANVLMYLGNRWFTFRLGRLGLWRTYPRYLGVGAVVGALNAVLLASLVEGAGTDPRLGQALSLAALTPLAFVLNKRWTFQLARV